MLTLRPIISADNARLRSVIRTVMPEFNCVGEGYSINDPELDDLYTTYSLPRSAFFALVDGDLTVGCGGYAPLTGGDGATAELRKMYLLPTHRGRGGGRLLLNACLAGARVDDFHRMYLETVTAMDRAARLYLHYGFRYLDAPLGDTGHGGCDRFMVRDLTSRSGTSSSASGRAAGEV